MERNMTEICFISAAVLVLLRISGLSDTGWTRVLSPMQGREPSLMPGHMVMIIVEEDKTLKEL